MSDTIPTFAHLTERFLIRLTSHLHLISKVKESTHPTQTGTDFVKLTAENDVIQCFGFKIYEAFLLFSIFVLNLTLTALNLKFNCVWNCVTAKLSYAPCHSIFTSAFAKSFVRTAFSISTSAYAVSKARFEIEGAI